MPVTVDSGAQATDDPLANDLKVSMETKVANQDVDNTQFSTLLMRMGSSEAKSFKEEWMEDQYLPQNTALSASATSADTYIQFTTNEGAYFKAGDIGKFVQTGEAFRVTTAGASAVPKFTVMQSTNVGVTLTLSHTAGAPAVGALTETRSYTAGEVAGVNLIHTGTASAVQAGPATQICLDLQDQFA